MWQRGSENFRLAAESTLHKYNCHETINESIVVKGCYRIWDVVVLEARKRGVSVSQTQWWSWKKYKV